MGEIKFCTPVFSKELNDKIVVTVLNVIKKELPEEYRSIGIVQRILESAKETAYDIVIL